MTDLTSYSDPKGFIQGKRNHWAKVWGEGKGDLTSLFLSMQEELYFDGPESMLPDLDAEDVDRSLRFVAPHTGLGIDVLRPGDFRLLPAPAKQEYARILMHCENLGDWPWQVLFCYG